VYKGDKLEPIETNGYNNSRSLDKFTYELKLIHKYLKQLGIEVEAIHKESGDG